MQKLTKQTKNFYNLDLHKLYLAAFHYYYPTSEGFVSIQAAWQQCLQSDIFLLKEYHDFCINLFSIPIYQQEASAQKRHCLKHSIVLQLKVPGHFLCFWDKMLEHSS